MSQQVRAVLTKSQGVPIFTDPLGMECPSNHKNSHPWRKATESVTCSVIIENSNTKLNHDQKQPKQNNVATTHEQRADSDQCVRSVWPKQGTEVTEASKQVDRSDEKGHLSYENTSAPTGQNLGDGFNESYTGND